MSSKNSSLLLKSLLLIQILLSINTVYSSYTDLTKTNDQGSSAIWIAFEVLLYWLIVGPLFVWGLKHPERHQRRLKFLGGLTVFLMLGLLVLLLAWINGDRQTGELISYAMKLMLSGLLTTYFIVLQVSGGWGKGDDVERSRNVKTGKPGPLHGLFLRVRSIRIAPKTVRSVLLHISAFCLTLIIFAITAILIYRLEDRLFSFVGYAWQGPEDIMFWLIAIVEFVFGFGFAILLLTGRFRPSIPGVVVRALAKAAQQAPLTYVWAASIGLLLGLAFSGFWKLIFLSLSVLS